MRPYWRRNRFQLLMIDLIGDLQGRPQFPGRRGNLWRGAIYQAECAYANHPVGVDGRVGPGRAIP